MSEYDIMKISASPRKDWTGEWIAEVRRSTPGVYSDEEIGITPDLAATSAPVGQGDGTDGV